MLFDEPSQLHLQSCVRALFPDLLAASHVAHLLVLVANPITLPVFTPIREPTPDNTKSKAKKEKPKWCNQGGEPHVDFGWVCAAQTLSVGLTLEGFYMQNDAL